MTLVRPSVRPSKQPKDAMQGSRRLAKGKVGLAVAEAFGRSPRLRWTSFFPSLPLASHVSEEKETARLGQ